MFDINRITVMGNLGKAPEIRTTQAGKEIMSFSVATRESWKDKNTGEWQEKTEWHRVVVFNEHLIKRAGNWLTKGSRVLVEGKLKVREWEDKDGNRRTTPEIVLSGFEGTIIPTGKPHKLGDEETSFGNEPAHTKQEATPNDNEPKEVFKDDDLPW